ncbi:hypothetical protein E4P41_01980 [Geodermatophilus sp. DF01-2]|uniref:hypothetical protein n=1 Tax=Geodermatophilus sp. DF01-2 TaxID=2559610 RepID=UPI0010736744|nr:hypothetical protein [Geodermatophilus sp. DF01_2]TFV64336.1 hypothetical protein E4P41_01980 [Geodermatophilus sp. DF01_2]
MSQQPSVEPGRPDPAAAGDERTRPVRVLPVPTGERPTRLIGNFVVPPPAGVSLPGETPSPTEAPAVAGPPTTVMPALPTVAGARPAPRRAVPASAAAPAPEAPADATSTPAAEPEAPVADRPTVHLPGGTGRPGDAATVAWLAGPGPGPLPYPRVVPRRHPVRALALFVLLLMIAAGVSAVVLLGSG